MSNGRLLAAEALIHAGNPLGAQSMLEELLKDDPENVRGRILYGLTFVDSEPQRALDMLQGALSDAPEMPVAHRSLGFAQLGCNKLDDAGESFTKANELSPEDPDTKMALATLASRKRTPAVAEFWIKKALNLRPEMLHPTRCGLWYASMTSGLPRRRAMRNAHYGLIPITRQPTWLRRGSV
jgi:cytochrome c-type biogenesis protein CcmH/NrfG